MEAVVRTSGHFVRWVTLLYLVQCWISSISAYLPPAVSVCPRSSPNLNQCVRQMIEQLRPNLLSGDYGNGTVLDTIEPIRIDHFVIDDGRNVKLVFTDLVARGAGAFTLDKISANIKERRISLKITLPWMQYSGKYSMRLKISVLEINGKGNFEITMGNVRVTMRMRYFPEVVNGREILRIPPIESKIVFDGEKHFNMTDLFKGNPALTAAANQAINENPDVIVDAATPVGEEFLTNYFTKIANGILSNASEEDMFPL